MNIDEILEQGKMAARLISPDINPLVMAFGKWAELQEITGKGAAEAITRVAMCLVSQATSDMVQQPEARAECGHDGCSRKVAVDMACMAALMASSFMAAQLFYAMEHARDSDGDEVYPQKARASINSAVRLMIDRENWTAGEDAVAQAEAGLTNLLRKMPKDMLASVLADMESGKEPEMLRRLAGSSAKARAFTFRVMRKVLAEGEG